MFSRLGMVCIMTCLAGWTVSARAAWVSGGTGELLRDQNNPWFLGSEPVEYCIRRANDYPLQFADLISLVDESLHDWQNFFTKYGLDKSTFGGDQGLGAAVLRDGRSRGISLTFRRVAICTDAAHQLTFLFGVTDDLVTTYMKGREPFTFGAAVHRDYDHVTYRTGGSVWLQNVGWLSDRTRIKHLLLHELGHVMGMSHNSVFVMDEDVATQIKSAAPTSCSGGTASPPYFGHIEAPGWPYHLLAGESTSLTFDGGGLAPSKTSCIPTGFYPNEVLPSALRAILGLSDVGFFSLNLRLMADDKSDKSLKVSASFNTPNGHEVTMSGLFWRDPDPTSDAMLRSPALCTIWGDYHRPMGAPPQVSGFGCERLDLRPNDFPASGVLTLPGQSFPAVIDYKKGPTLKLLLPGGAKWWTFVREFLPDAGAGGGISPDTPT